MDPVVHFEMPYDDHPRMTKFYQAAFGWVTQALAEEMGNYVLATTALESTPPERNAPSGTSAIIWLATA